MKQTIIALIAMLLFFGISAAGKQIETGAKFRNHTQKTIYVVYAVPPGDTFENKLDRPVQILKSQNDLFEFHKRLELDFLIDKVSASVQAKAARLDSLQRLQQKIDDGKE